MCCIFARNCERVLALALLQQRPDHPDEADRGPLVRCRQEGARQWATRRLGGEEHGSAKCAKSREVLRGARCCQGELSAAFNDAGACTTVHGARHHNRCCNMKATSRTAHAQRHQVKSMHVPEVTDGGACRCHTELKRKRTRPILSRSSKRASRETGRKLSTQPP